MAGLVHLARRFVGSLWPGGPPAADDAWARYHLLPAEAELWVRLKGYDRRHAMGVARWSARALGAEATRPVVAAALLHDVGKLSSGLGVFGRVAATVWASVRGRERAASRESRTANYLNHPAIGAEMLRAAGSDPLTIAWAREHHRPAAAWTVKAAIAAALKAADDD